MARIRTIKPEFFLDEDLGELSALHRLAFAGIWCQADCAGRLEDRPRRLKLQVLPYDDCDFDRLLADLEACSGRFIVRYEAGGERFIQIRNFLKHQRLSGTEAAARSAFPAPPKEALEKHSGSAEEAPRNAGKEGKGREGKGKDLRAAVAAPLPDQQTPPSPPAPPSAEKPKPAPDPRHQPSLAAWAASYEAATRTKATILPADAKAVQLLLRSIPGVSVEEISHRMVRALAVDWFRRSPDLKTFCSKWSAWVPSPADARLAADLAVGRPAPPPTTPPPQVERPPCGVHGCQGLAFDERQVAGLHLCFGHRADWDDVREAARRKLDFDEQATWSAWLKQVNPDPLRSERRAS